MSEESIEKLQSQFDETNKDKLCAICNEKRDYSIQIGSTGKDVVFCNICGQIVAQGILKLERKGWLTVND